MFVPFAVQSFVLPRLRVVFFIATLSDSLFSCFCSFFLVPFSFSSYRFLCFNRQIGLPGQRPVIAVGIRALIHLSAVKDGKTGPAMNPMIATAWVRMNSDMYARLWSISRDCWILAS